MSAAFRNVRRFSFAVLVSLVPAAAHAAALTQVSGWQGGVSLPSDVTMSIYVPDKLAANPPLVTVIHYCGGNAQAVFGQAKDIRAAADKFGFIMILPAQTHSGGCWDVSSKKTQTHDGGGDTHAIAQMVKYALAQHKANPNRVYSTGDSSGGMMTQLLMAVYPDIFKAGSAFAGVPAGCSNVFDGSGLCGLPAQTAQQWGDRVRAMYPGYTGHRPRVQLVHGDADAIITYKNQAEAIKEWTNVLGLSTEPTTKVDTGLMLGSHQARRQQWKDSCYVRLDVLTSVNGDHGPSDALFQGNYVLPFLGLDTQAAVDATTDPELAQCAGGGTDGGVPTTDGGRDGAGSGSGGAAGGGGRGGNGAGGSGGSAATGTGGAASGGSGPGPSTGGVSGASAGRSGANTGGANSGGAAVSSGGAVGSGGASSGNGSGGAAGSPSGTGGAASSGAGDGEAAGCACAMGTEPTGASAVAVVMALGLLAFRRKRR